MLYNIDDLQDQFGFTLTKAVDYYLQQGLVSHPDLRQDGRLITSVIQMPGSRPYRVYIRIEPDLGEGVKFHGECSCGVKGNCEHVAAVLLRSLIEVGEVEDVSLQEDRFTMEPLTDSPSPSPYPDEVKQRLLYLLFPEPGGDSGLPIVTVSGRTLKGGGFGALHHYQPESVLRGKPPRFLLKEDRDLLTELTRLKTAAWSDERRLEDATGERLLLRVLETGRCYLGDAEYPLRPGKARKAQFHWEMDEQGYQHPVFAFAPPTPFILLLQNLWYLDPETGESGKLETGFPQPVLPVLFERLDGVAPGEAAAVNSTLAKLIPDETLPALQVFEAGETVSVKPTPCLRVYSHVEDFGFGQEIFDEAKLSFDYAGHRFSGDEPSQWHEEGRLIRVERDHPLEDTAVNRLLTWGFESDDYIDQSIFLLDKHPEPWLDFQSDLLPELRRDGWQVEFDPGFRFRLLEIDHWYGSLQPKEDNDWFRVGLGVEVEGERINLLPALVNLLMEYPKLFDRRRLQELDPNQMLVLTLEDQRLVSVPISRIRLILDTLFELYQDGSLDGSGELAMSRIQLARLAEMEATDEGLQLSGDGAQALQDLIQCLRGLEQLPAVQPPKGLKAELRDYQQQGLTWLQFLRENELGGVLADDMGLGKTVQTLAHILLEKEQGRLDRPALVVAPTSLLVNWRREAHQFTPDLRVMILHGAKRGELFSKIPAHDLVITSYPLLSRDKVKLSGQIFHLLILDEAQYIKNAKTQASKVVRQLDARHRLCLTGTPLENHLGELWSQFDFLLPGLLGSDKQFRRNLRNPIEKHGDEAASERLAVRLRPFMLRRTKQEVAKELPPKTEILRTVELEGDQRELYETIRLAMHEQVRQAVQERGWARSQIMVLDALLKLRQVCCDPRLVKLEDARNVKQSAKLELLMEMLPELVEEGRRVLLFSQFTGMLTLIEAAVKKAGIDYVKLTGRTRDRATPVERFQNGEAPLFLISLKAGGTGLNLTAADTVIHYDPWWNPAVERQATDRAHRIGQRNPVFVYKLISEGTVEEVIQQMQAHKQALADNLFEKGGGSMAGWSEDDINLLFGPME